MMLMSEDISNDSYAVIKKVVSIRFGWDDAVLFSVHWIVLAQLLPFTFRKGLLAIEFQFPSQPFTLFEQERQLDWTIRYRATVGCLLDSRFEIEYGRTVQND